MSHPSTWRPCDTLSPPAMPRGGTASSRDEDATSMCASTCGVGAGGGSSSSAGTGEVRRGWMGSCSTQGWQVTLPQWQAMHGVLGGAMPTWVDSHGRPNEDRKRAKTVSVLVRAMQGVLEERLKEHRRKAAPAAAWITEREERRGLIRHVFAAWAGTHGSHNVPDAHYSRDAWQEWRRRENPPATQSATHM